ncbi:extracellular solute-binding protein [Bacillus sp. 1P06AnD]|uniref:extracellular solute-binding protein n=1 Tax=Bacillus sp. 1P06AnD TaxID=3132208 RepID=UPI0039A3D0D8
MKSMKKYGLLIMVFALISLMAACGNDKKEEGTAKDNDKTLTISVEESYKGYINDIKDKFEKDNNAKLKVNYKSSFDQLDALALDGPAGKAPDVMLSPYDRVGSLGQQGHLMEIKENDQNKLDAKDLKTVTIDGKRYGNPFTIETLVQFYNKDLVDKAPATMDEAEALTKDPRFAFANEAGKSTAFLANWNDFYVLYGEMAGFGGYVFGKDGTDPKDVGLANKGSIEGLEYAAKWYKEHWPKGMQDVKSAPDFVNKMFIDKKAASIIGGPWSAAQFKESKVNYGVAEIPTLPNGKKYTPFAGGKAWVVSAYTKHSDLAQKWIDYVANADNSYKFYQATNEIPINKEAQDKVKQDNNELANAVISTYQVAPPMPNIPEMSEIWAVGGTLMSDVNAGKKDPKQVAKAAVKTINENIEQKFNK